MKAVALTRYADIDHPESVSDTELKAVSVNQPDNSVRRPKDEVESSRRAAGSDRPGGGDQLTSGHQPVVPWRIVTLR